VELGKKKNNIKNPMRRRTTIADPEDVRLQLRCYTCHDCRQRSLALRDTGALGTGKEINYGSVDNLSQLLIVLINYAPAGAPKNTGFVTAYKHSLLL
jgi:hypothetical protein